MTTDMDTRDSLLRREYVIWWVLLILVIGLLIGAGFVQWLHAPGDGSRDGKLPILGTISDFTLIERSGRRINRKCLAGKVSIVDFVFTRCASTCPMMTSRMATLQQRLRGSDDVQLVSISVDPLRDTPAVLTEYAARYDADPDRWWFLTGDMKAIYRLSHESFRLTVEAVPEDEREPDMEAVLHSTKFVLLDRDVRIRGYYDGVDRADVDRLYEGAMKLLEN